MVSERKSTAVVLFPLSLLVVTFISVLKSEFRFLIKIKVKAEKLS